MSKQIIGKKDRTKVERQILGALRHDLSLFEALSEFKIDREYFKDKATQELYGYCELFKEYGQIKITKEVLQDKGLKDEVVEKIEKEFKSLEENKANENLFRLWAAQLKQISSQEKAKENAGQIEELTKKGVSGAEYFMNAQRIIEDYGQTLSTEEEIIFTPEIYRDDYHIEKGSEPLSICVDEISDEVVALHRSVPSVISADSGIGKTTLALNIAVKLASQGKKVLFISQEMTKRQVGEKIAFLMKDDGDKYRLQNQTEEENKVIKKELEAEAEAIFGENLGYTQCNTYSSLKTMIKKADQLNYDLIIYDYFQKMEIDIPGGTDDYLKVALASKGITDAVKQTNLAFLWLSQITVNKKAKDIVEASQNATVKNSTQLYNDTALEIRMYKKKDDDGNAIHSHLYLYTKKNRFGLSEEEYEVPFNGKTQKIGHYKIMTEDANEKAKKIKEGKLNRENTKDAPEDPIPAMASGAYDHLTSEEIAVKIAMYESYLREKRHQEEIKKQKEEK